MNNTSLQINLQPNLNHNKTLIHGKSKKNSSSLFNQEVILENALKQAYLDWKMLALLFTLRK